MISDQYRCVYVHIPKTAGTSIERALGWIGDDVIGPYGTVPYGVQDHRTLNELRLAMPTADFDAYFKFTFVRNPWARVVSWYRNVISDAVHRGNFGIAADSTLRDFLVRHGSTWGLQPLRYWIGDRSGALELDFIGRFETLRSDFDTVRKRLGVPAVELPHLTQSNDRTHYRSLYDHECREIVAQRYAEEIGMFDYRFDG